MRTYQRIGLRVGMAGFFVGMLVMFLSMGLPLGSIVLAIPVGMVTGRQLVRTREPVSFEITIHTGLIAGVLTAFGAAIPLMAIALVSPRGATLSGELSHIKGLPGWMGPDMIPQPLDSIRVAMTLGAAVSAIIILFLVVGSCRLTVGWLGERYRKESAAETESR